MSTLSMRLKLPTLVLRAVDEPDLTYEDGAREFLERLRNVTRPPQKRPLKELFLLRGHQYYAVYITIVTVALVFVIFPMLSALGSAGRYETGWVDRAALLILHILTTVMWFYMILGFGYEWLLGGRLAGSGGPAAVDTGMYKEERVRELILKQCSLELKYLVDTLNDKVALINQTLSYFIPSLLFLYVVTTVLSGTDPTKDNTSISIITYAASLVVGTFATLVVVPLRFIAHTRLSKYREWLKQVETVLLTSTEAELSIKNS